MVLLCHGRKLSAVHTDEDPWAPLRAKIEENTETLSRWAGHSPLFENIEQLHSVGRFAAHCIDWGNVLFYVHRTGSGSTLLTEHDIDAMVETAERAQQNVLESECSEHLRCETRATARLALHEMGKAETWGYYAVAVEAETWGDVNAPISVRFARQHRVVSNEACGKALVYVPDWFTSLAEENKQFAMCEAVDRGAADLDILRGALVLWDPWRLGQVGASYARALRAVRAVWRKDTKTAC